MAFRAQKEAGRPRAQETRLGAKWKEGHTGPIHSRAGLGFCSSEMGVWAKEWQDLTCIFQRPSVRLLGGKHTGESQGDHWGGAGLEAGFAVILVSRSVGQGMARFPMCFKGYDSRGVECGV